MKERVRGLDQCLQNMDSRPLWFFRTAMTEVIAVVVYFYNVMYAMLTMPRPNDSGEIIIIIYRQKDMAPMFNLTRSAHVVTCATVTVSGQNTLYLVHNFILVNGITFQLGDRLDLLIKAVVVAQ